MSESSSATCAANRANAQLSTGPRTEEGKAKSSLNAVKTGLTGRTVLLPSDHVPAYQAHMDVIFNRHQPETDEERELVQEIAETKWRLDRIPVLEADLYALGSVPFASMFEDHDPACRAGLIRAHSLHTYGKRFDNLYLQESRLARRLEKTMENLTKRQFRRRADECAALSRPVSSTPDTAAPVETVGQLAGRMPVANPDGFEFSNSSEGCFADLSPAEKAKVWKQVQARFRK